MRVKADRKEDRYVRVFLNGEDISARCMEADDEEGWAVCVKLNERGHAYSDLPDSDYPAKETLYGTIRIERTQ